MVFDGLFFVRTNYRSNLAWTNGVVGGRIRGMSDGVDRRFDPNHAAQLLLDLAHGQAVEHLLRMLVTRVAERPNLACAQVWLVGVGDRCGGCVHRSWCPDRAR